MPHSDLGIRHCSALFPLLLSQQNKPIWQHLLLLPFSAFLLPRALSWPCAELFNLSQATQQLKIGKRFRSELGSHSEEGGCRRQEMNCTYLTQKCLHDSDPLSPCAHSSWNAIVQSYYFSISSEEVKKQCILWHLCRVSLGKLFTFILLDSRVQYTKFRKGPQIIFIAS